MLAVWFVLHVVCSQTGFHLPSLWRSPWSKYPSHMCVWGLRIFTQSVRYICVLCRCGIPQYIGIWIWSFFPSSIVLYILSETEFSSDNATHLLSQRLLNMNWQEAGDSHLYSYHCTQLHSTSESEDSKSNTFSFLEQKLPMHEIHETGTKEMLKHLSK